MKNNKSILFLCIFLIAITVSGCGLLADEKPDTAITNPDKPDVNGESEDVKEQGQFSSVDLDGNLVTQEIFADSKLTVVNVWATYCGPCINEMPYLGELAGEYDSSEVQIIGIPSDVVNQEYLDYAKSLVEQTGADYVHILPTEDVYNWGLYNIQYVPTTFFVNSDGEIMDTVVGSMSKEDWKILIDDKLASM